MKQYETKPVRVWAERWQGWGGCVIIGIEKHPVYPQCGWIAPLSRFDPGKEVKKGDWVLKDSRAGLTAMSDEEFKNTYREIKP